jgi:two-component system sensor histidine kinase NreB
VSVRATDTEIHLSVMDDGVGFTVGEPLATDFGLLAMRERAALIGGDLQILSQPGSGSHVSVRAPLEPSHVAPPTPDEPQPAFVAPSLGVDRIRG